MDNPFLENLISERESAHGKFYDNAQVYSSFLRCIPEGFTFSWYPYQIYAFHQILSKLARIVVGNPHFSDHWVDIQGYARLVEKELEIRPEEPAAPMTREEVELDLRKKFLKSKDEYEEYREFTQRLARESSNVA